MRFLCHYSDVTMSRIASQITSVSIVYSTVWSSADQRKHQSSASPVTGIHRWPVNSPHKGPVTRKMFPFDDAIMVVEKNLSDKSLPLVLSPEYSGTSGASSLMIRWCIASLLRKFPWNVNWSRHGQNGSRFADDIFRCIFVNEKFCILIGISLKFVP